jgi:hypothetical protein
MKKLILGFLLLPLLALGLMVMALSVGMIGGTQPSQHAQQDTPPDLLTPLPGRS